jgi:hypothetical protein
MSVIDADSAPLEQRRRVFIHVGSPKTGSTFLQEIVWSQRETAEKQGLLLPMASFFDHFLATVDVREMADQPRFPARAAGTWERMVEEGRRWPGDVLISHELFAGATAEQARRAVLAWGDSDVHVIVTARDLARQMPAEWQEHLKHRSTMTFPAFLDALRAHGPEAEWFWLVQDFADVCRRWGDALPADHVHLVTVPPRGAAQDLLWKRFAILVGLEPDAFDLTASRSNASLKGEQAELLRLINTELGERLSAPGEYPVAVKEVLAQGVLQGRPGTAILLDRDSLDFATDRSRQVVDEIVALGVDVVGDLAELIPPDTGEPSQAPPHPEAQEPAGPRDADLLGEGIAAVIGLLVRYTEERERATAAEQAQHRLERELDHAVAEIAELVPIRERHDQLRHDMLHRPFHHLVIGLSESHPSVMRVRVHYWHAVELARRLMRRPRTD